MAQTGDAVESGRLINLVPVGLKEAAIDSPTSRATVQHFADQVDHLEKWLDEYLKATNRLVVESGTLENILNNFTSHAVLPTTISETMLDHDYSVLAMKKYAEGAKDYWMSMIGVVKLMSSLVCDPIRQFYTNEIKPFKEARRIYDYQQKTYDQLQSRYMSLGRYKEPSSLREDAFQVHEARKAYLKAQLDLFQMAPQFRFALDKLMVRIFFDQWREMRQARDNTANTFHRSAQDMDRVRGWAKEMESSETSFRKELIAARKQLEEAAEQNAKPSRELDDYSAYTLPHVGHAHTASSTTVQKSPTRTAVKSSEKQGWLYLRTYTGKPTRVSWVKKWAFVRNGVFGWLIQDNRGFVEESERIGVLLCAVRPAPAEERRFCFELKTNKHTIGLQAETQSELASWIAAFEAAKTKAVEEPGSSDALAGAGQPHTDPAFTISPPPVSEFGTSVLPSTEPFAGDDNFTVDRTATLPVPGTDTTRESVDLLRRTTGVDDGSKDPASRIMSKLDLHRRTPTTPQMTSTPTSPSAGGGIASLIAASHGSMPVGPAIPILQRTADDSAAPRRPIFTLPTRDTPPSTLAPSTLANTPTPTGLSKAAVVVAAERGVRGTFASKHGIPNGILANTWGSSNSSFVNRFDPSELRVVSETRATLQASPLLLPSSSPPKVASVLREGTDLTSLSSVDLVLPPPISRSRTPSPGRGHRNTISIEKPRQVHSGPVRYPNHYPLQLKTQDAQFRLLFPNVRKEEQLTMVFRATWNPSGNQDFPGRAYVTTRELYFYSNHFGLVLTSGISLSTVDEVTAAPGRDCDFLFVHFKETQLNGATRVTIKTFLEPLKLLQRRLNFLVRNCQSPEPLGLEDVIKTLLKMENDTPQRSPSLESWEDLGPETPLDRGPSSRSYPAGGIQEFRSPVRVDRALHTSISADGERVAKFKLPAQPVRYTPPGYTQLAVEREFDVSPKALFHVMFGDRSVLWQLLQHEREAKDLRQGPWTPMGEGRLFRDFEFNIPTTNFFGQQKISAVKDYQTVDVVNDHLCYVVTDRRTPWHLPFQSSYRLLSKIVITHVAKTKCKLSIYIRVDWSNDPWAMKNALERHALHDLELDAQDLADLVSDQVRKLGLHSRTKKAVQIFGQVGQSSEVTQLEIDASALKIEMRRAAAKRTMTSLVMENAGSSAQSWIGIILQSLLDIVSWLGKTISANSFILLLLTGSIIYNSWFVTRDGFEWWHERNTAKFMKQLGVTPNMVMSKAVYVSDLDVAMSAAGILPDRDASACYNVFHDDYSLQDVDAPLGDDTAKDSSSSRVSRPSARRVQSTRQRLGSYRHDLLVAMRVVNSIEREVVQSEWENWLVSENRRCKTVEPVVEAAKNQTSSVWQKIAGGGTKKGEAENKELVKWYDEYCGSCREEYKRTIEKVDIPRVIDVQSSETEDTEA